jgi:hypothetical protein
MIRPTTGTAASGDSRSTMTSDRIKATSALALAGLLLGAGVAHAQFDLGSQRAGTSSGSFLKIGVGARAVAMGEAFVAVANDPSAIVWNPAGLASIIRHEVQFTHTEWPGDINYDYLVYVMPSHRLGGSLAVQVGMLGTQMDETDEYHPFGTGTTFSYSDFVAGVAYGRRWTDKLLIGAGLKYVREDLGSQVGGPVTTSTLVDLGSIYYLGYGSVRIATSLTNFGAEMTPGGSYVSPYSGERRNYDGFDPPIQFRYGLAFEAFENPRQRLTVSTEILQPADNAQRIKTGLEWVWQRRFALRTGYNFNADVMRFSAGLGIAIPMSLSQGSFDYTFTDAGPLGSVSRMSLGLRF